MASATESEVDDWQGNKTSLDCNRYMLTHQCACDVTFLLGENAVKVPAHKYILFSRSCVFFAMFCGKMAETNTEIRVPDIEPEVFQSLLEYMYCDEIHLNPELVLPMLYASKKYSIQTLTRRCLQFLEQDRSPENICSILEQAHLFDEKDLEKNCLEYIHSHSKEVLSSAGFLQLCPTCITRVVESDDLQCEEKIVLDAVLKWAQKLCEKRDMVVTGMNQREVLGPLLYHIRFPLLGDTYFTEVVSDMDILNDAEKVELFKFFYKSGTVSEHFICRNRLVTNTVVRPALRCDKQPDNKSIQTCMRYQTVSEGSWYCGGEPDAIAFTCSQAIWLHGALVYGSYIGEGTYDVSCGVYDCNDREMMQTKTQLRTSENQQTYLLLLDSPIEITEARKYTFLVRLTSPEGIDTYQGRNGMTSVTCGPVKFNFFKSKFSRNGSDVKNGQVPGLLFSL